MTVDDAVEESWKRRRLAGRAGGLGKGRPIIHRVSAGSCTKASCRTLLSTFDPCS